MTGTPPAAAAALGANRHTSDPPSRPAAAASRRAKIVSTLGPATHTYEKVRSRVEARMDVARLNFSHGSHEDNERAFAKVREDKKREAGDGFDGSWVAHPDLVPVCREAFDEVLGNRPNQLDVRRNVSVTAQQLLDVSSIPGSRTLTGLRNNVDVGVQYLEAWLRGNGAVGIHNLMEDAATAEISRSQIWQWVYNGVVLESGEKVTPELVRQILDEELAALRQQVGEGWADRRYEQARDLFEQVALADEFADFLTLPAYEVVD
jgi:malate synthase